MQEDDRDAERKLVDDMLKELERVGITVIEREPVADNGSQYDALILIAHEGVEVLSYLDTWRPGVSNLHLRLKLPFPLLLIMSAPPSIGPGKDGGRDGFRSFEIATHFHNRGDMTRIERAEGIPPLVTHTLKRWNVLDEVVHNSEDYLLGRDLTPTPPRKDGPAKKGATKKAKPDAKDTPAPDAPTTASARFDHDTKACVDAPPDKPGLDFDHIAASIVSLIDEIASETTQDKATSSAPLMTIGLYGPWGAGKSTLIRALQNVFCAKNYITITINPWKWDGKGDIHAYVFKHFRATLKKRFPFPMFMVSVRRVLKALGRLMWYVIAMAFIVSAATALDDAGLFKAAGFDKLQTAMDWVKPESGGLILGGTGAAISAIMLFFWKHIRTKTDDLIDKQLFGHRPDALGAEGLSTAYQDIAAGWKAVGKDIPPFVFFFDDLDRCSPERVALFAETVHSLTAAGCVTFISCDEAYITAALNAKYEAVWRHHPDGDKFGQRFLEKIVQIPYRVPSVQERHLKELGLATTRQNYRPIPEAGIASRTARATSMQSTNVDATATPESTQKSHVSWPVALSGILDLIDLFRTPFNLTEDDEDSLTKLGLKAIEQARPSGDEQALRIAAFILADRYIPEWLDDYTGHAPGKTDFPPQSEDLEATLRKHLGEDKAELLALYDHVSMRLPSVLSWLLSGAVEPMRLNLRQVKALSNTINLHLRISNTLSEDEARRVAAFVFADMHDPAWLDRLYHRGDGKGTEIGLYPDLEQRLRDVLGTEPAELLPLYGQIGRHPALRPPGETADKAAQTADEAPKPS